MKAVKLLVSHLIASVLKPRHKATAAPLDGQHVVPFAVGNEQSRRANLVCGGHKAGGEGDRVGKQVAIGEANREGVGSTIGETRDRHSAWVYGITIEGLCQRPVNKGNVRTVATPNDIPG